MLVYRKDIIDPVVSAKTSVKTLNGYTQSLVGPNLSFSVTSCIALKQHGRDTAPRLSATTTCVQIVHESVAKKSTELFKNLLLERRVWCISETKFKKKF